jgi:hypothetical protein
MSAARTSLTMVIVPTQVTDRQAMAEIGNALVLIIRRRTLQGRGADGRPFEGYATRRIYVNPNRGVGARLKPKGGVVTKGGRGKTMRFDGGYAEFKRLSRGAGATPRGGSASAPTAEVDLTLSGQLMRSIAPAQITDPAVVVQVGEGAAEYGEGVNERRPFMGLAPQEGPALEAVANAAVAGALRRATEAQRQVTG